MNLPNVATISRDAPSRISMDFERLRSEGITHLEELTTYIWTDFNVHDPGITILEVLCYAITDLGYRANLPIEDLLSDRSGGTKNQFPTAVEVLPMGPVTPRDLRKVLIDFPEVRNAWVSKASANNKDYKCGNDWYDFNGLYHICLDTQAAIDPNSKEAKLLIDKIYKGYSDPLTSNQYQGLYSYRNLGEDFYKVEIAKTQKICLCLDVEIENDSDELDVMANIIFKLQGYLTPGINFYSLQEMLEKGYSCEDIYNGPLLNNGFIVDEELDKAIIQNEIKLSDLYRVILETDKVKSVNGLLIKKIEDDNFSKNWCLPIDQLEGQTCIVKPVIDLCCSSMHIRKNGTSREVFEKDIVDLISLKEMMSQQPAVQLHSGELPKGTYRPDLSEYVSIQHEFPHNYMIGDHGVPKTASPLRKAQSKQLQAYLLFFDRLLADYLKHLSEVKNLLSVDHNAEGSTYFYQALYEVPGVKELITRQPYTLTGDSLELLKEDLSDDSIKGLEEKIGSTYLDLAQLDHEMKELLGQEWNNHGKKILRAFEEQDYNYYLDSLREIVESENTQVVRKQKLLNHLLARFGEKFSEYSIMTFQSKKDHLTAKANFLKDLPDLGANRATAYNYRSINSSTGQLDVWNTVNVSGLKKRIYRLMGWDSVDTSSVLTDPLYRLDELEDNSKELPYRYFILNRLKNKNVVDGPPLLRSSKSYSIRKLKQLKHSIYVQINNPENYTIKPQQENDDGYQVVFSPEIFLKKDSKESFKMKSRSLSEREAKHLLDEIKSLITVRMKRGFHIVEHILLRPNDEKDLMLNMPCEISCAKDIDPYSFWISVIAPAWKGNFSKLEYRENFKQVALRETPAHIATCFRWIEKEDTMEKLEDALEQWRESFARCTPDECEITEKANILITLLNNIPCDCGSASQPGRSKCPRPSQDQSYCDLQS